MADESPSRSNVPLAQALLRTPAALSRLALSPTIDSRLRTALPSQPGSNLPVTDAPLTPPSLSAAPAPVTPPAPTPLAPPVVPAAPGANPFPGLPFPAPGDRIKADDFKALSQALTIIADMTVLSGSLCGHPFGAAKMALASQGYQIVRVISVFGAELDNLGDASLDGRKVIQVLPVMLGERQLVVVVTEAVDTRRFVPNLLGLTYQEAQERLRVLVGDMAQAGAPPIAPPLIGVTLDQAQQAFTR